MSREPDLPKFRSAVCKSLEHAVCRRMKRVWKKNRQGKVYDRFAPTEWERCECACHRRLLKAESERKANATVWIEPG